MYIGPRGQGCRRSKWDTVTHIGSRLGEGDGLNDVVTALQAHGFGLAWFEQKRDASKTISFVRHMISDDFASKNAGGVTFSEPHGSTCADMDGDGISDFVVGKRFFSHQESTTDPDPLGAPVLYVYKTVRKKTAAGVTLSDDMAIGSFMLDEARCAVVPGSAFGAPGYARLSYATSRELIQSGIDRIQAAVATLT